VFNDFPDREVCIGEYSFCGFEVVDALFRVGSDGILPTDFDAASALASSLSAINFLLLMILFSLLY
jgi:hypothetical protein